MKLLQLALMTGMLCVASFTKIQSQTADSKLQDSIIISVQPGLKIILTGQSLKDLLKYKRSDSLIQLFLSDFSLAAERKAVVNSRAVHYVVNANGKRRLKAENEDFQEPAFNLVKEAKAMTMELPPMAYYIYDVQTATEIQIFTTSPEKLKTLADLNLADLLIAQKIKSAELRRTRSYVLQRTDSNWKGTARVSAPKDLIVFSPLFGLSVIGSKLSPETGFKLSLLQSDRYDRLKWSAGLSYNLNVLSSYDKGDFSDIQDVQSMNAFFMATARGSEERLWGSVGAQLGYVFKSTGVLNNSIKFGLFTTFKGYQLGFNTYFLRNEEVLYGLSLLF
jgi:hypothetical protein